MTAVTSGIYAAVNIASKVYLCISTNVLNAVTMVTKIYPNICSYIFYLTERKPVHISKKPKYFIIVQIRVVISSQFANR